MILQLKSLLFLSCFFYDREYKVWFLVKKRMEGIMKNTYLALLSICLLFEDALASQANKESWKVSFFKEYIDGYGALQEPGHEEIAQILQKSFDQAALAAPEQDQHLVIAVRDQVSYFANIENEEEKERELEKCKEGMKQACSPWARFAPEAVKAKFFVDRFVEEANKRQEK